MTLVVIPYITPFKEFRLQLAWGFLRISGGRKGGGWGLYVYICVYIHIYIYIYR